MKKTKIFIFLANLGFLIWRSFPRDADMGYHHRRSDVDLELERRARLIKAKLKSQQ